MNRKLSLPFLTCLLAGIISMSAMNTASAQQNLNQCDYVVIVTGLTGICGQLPIPLSLRWECPQLTPPQTFTTVKNYFGNGMFVEPIGNPPLPPCPPTPACKLIGISLDGITFISVGYNGNFMVGSCCYGISTGTDQNGRVIIKISYC